jgi:hypothetical protein
MSLGVRAWPLIVLALLAPGCASLRSSYRAVSPGVHTIGNAYTVDPRITWSRTYMYGLYEMWTVDGTGLETLRFYTGITDGQPILRGGANEAQRPRFRASMTAAEISDLVAASLFGSRYPPRDVRPAPFGGVDGFRFEVSYAVSGGVKREAIVTGAVVDKRLHVIAYEGTALYHFAKYREEAEHIVRSVRLRPTASR